MNQSVRQVRRALRGPAVVGLGLVLAVSATGCSRLGGAPSSNAGGGSSGSSASGPVTITVGNRPTADQKASRTVFDKQVSDFEKANPDITIKDSTTEYDPQTFQTLLAGGNLPDVLSIPFTEPPTLIARKQLADITAQVNQVGLQNTLNPTTLAIAQDSAKRIYGVPTAAYAVGLNYNRKLFTQAGLDPDSPPQTWDQVRTDAKIIAQKTGATGFAQMSNNNCGGWMFTAMTYAFGGSLESADGSKATFADTSAAANALQLLHTMKWDDKSMGKQNLYDCDSIQQDFAAGKVGMYLKAPDDYTNLVVQYGMDSADFGAAGMPAYQGSTRRTLTGGSVSVVSPKATDAQKLAGVKWIQYSSLRRYTNQAEAVAEAKAAKADKAPVAVPGLSVVSQQAYDTYFTWVKPYNNVPVSNFTPYLNAQQGQTITAEPKNQAQKVYAALDSLIQKVLTDQKADIPSLLQKAQSSVTAQIAER